MQDLKVLLVDDEQIVLKDLKNIIDWNAIGFTIIGTAHNGKSALRLYKDFHPDLIITDIIMPQMNGIDFIHEIRKLDPDVYILILSSYSEFAYAKAAISEGVFDYLLKLEITSTSLTKKLKEIYIKLTSHKKKNKKAARLELQEYFNRVDIDTFNWSFHDSPDTKKLIFIIFSSAVLLQSDFLCIPIEQPLETMLRNLESVLHHLNVPSGTILFPKKAAFILGVEAKSLASSNSFRSTPSATDITSFIKKISSCWLLDEGDLLKAIYWDSPLTLAQFCKRYHTAFPLINWYLVTSQKPFVPFSYVESHNYRKNPPFKKFESLIQLKSKEEQLKYIRSHSKKSYENHDVQNLQDTFLYVCERAKITPTPLLLTQIIANGSSFEDFLYAGFQIWMDALPRETEFHYSATISHAIQYISEHYADSHINLETISDCIGLSSGRLSVLFKKETGKTPVEWITNCRIQEAISLLLDSNYKIYEISEKVGYRSSQYFSQIFYQHTGKKPLDYRKNTSITYKLGE